MDAGIPNEERIILRPTRVVNLRGFGIAVGVAVNENSAMAIHDNIFWFPEMVVEPNAWLFIYTGKGTFRQSTAGGSPAIVFHWQRATTLFGREELVPVLFQAMNVEVGVRLKFPLK